MQLFGHGVGLTVDIVTIRGLKLLVPNVTMEFFGPRVNIAGFVSWCDICFGSPIKFYCGFEEAFTCDNCNEHCSLRAHHNWEVLSQNVSEKANYVSSSRRILGNSS